MNSRRCAPRFKYVVILLVVSVILSALLFGIALSLSDGSSNFLSDAKLRVLEICDSFRGKYFGLDGSVPANASAPANTHPASSVVYYPEDDYMSASPGIPLKRIWEDYIKSVDCSDGSVPANASDPAVLSSASGHSLSLYVSGEITSPYGYRLDPITKAYTKFHKGIDFAGNTGEPVYPAGSGTIIVAEYESSYGNYVMVDHGGGIVTLYAHMSKLCTVAGEYVDKNTKLGEIGSTGNSTGPHLHFETILDGTNVDPATLTEFLQTPARA